MNSQGRIVGRKILWMSLPITFSFAGGSQIPKLCRRSVNTDDRRLLASFADEASTPTCQA